MFAPFIKEGFGLHTGEASRIVVKTQENEDDDVLTGVARVEDAGVRPARGGGGRRDGPGAGVERGAREPNESEYLLDAQRLGSVFATGLDIPTVGVGQDVECGPAYGVCGTDMLGISKNLVFFMLEVRFSSHEHLVNS